MKILSMQPELLVDNMKDSLDFYTSRLGFTLITSVPEDSPFFAILGNNGTAIMLYSRKQFSEEIPKFQKAFRGGTFALYIETENVEELFESLKDWVKIIQQLHDTNYGSREFSIEDPNGYVLMFNQRISP